MALSKYNAVRMGSDYFTLMRNAEQESRPALAKDFRSRAETIKVALEVNGWRILPDGINVERVRR